MILLSLLGKLLSVIAGAVIAAILIDRYRGGPPDRPSTQPEGAS